MVESEIFSKIKISGADGYSGINSKEILLSLNQAFGKSSSKNVFPLSYFLILTSI